jgi:LmbE family N-acetylglucosaminyl deacetylase
LHWIVAKTDSARRRLKRLLYLLLLVCLAGPAYASGPPLSREAEFRELLRKLQTTARLIHTTAHPDDEDGAMLTLESRGEGAQVLLLTLNRGEGGQNRMGSNLLDVLGVLRTLELLAADQYYGVEQRFTRVADFGFSKSAEETFQTWQGHDLALRDMVRVIRQFRPDVLVSRFQGTARDGHGHHIAAGILTREAFRAAADPQRFPEQIQEGLLPWQPKKLYTDNVRPFGATAPPSPDAYTVALNTDAVDPMLETSYLQFARTGLRHQLSQGAGSWNLPPGPHVSYYKLVDSVLPMPAAGTHERDFFDGIRTTLPALASRLGEEESLVPFLWPALVELQGDIEWAASAAETNISGAGPTLLAALALARQLIAKVEESKLSAAAKSDLLVPLRAKQEQLQRAANLALGVELQATVDAPPSATPQDVFVAVPGRSFDVSVNLQNHGAEPIIPHTFAIDLPKGWSWKQLGSAAVKPISPGENATAKFSIFVPAGAELTRPYWHRDHPERDAIYTLDQPRYATLPFAPPPVRVFAICEVKQRRADISAVAEVLYRDAMELKRMPLAVGPELSVSLQPAMQVLPVSNRKGIDVAVSVQKQVPGDVNAEVRLQLPPGWRSEPPSSALHIKAGESRASVQFHLLPKVGLSEGRAVLKAVVSHNGKAYSEGYTVVTRPDLDAAAFYFQPAQQQVSVVDVKLPPHLKAGYLMGAGDEIPSVLRQAGLDVSILSASELAGGNLRAFDTIVLGIRAYDVREDVRQYNSRLLEYVADGGTLVVQYNSAVAEFNAGRFTPYPAQLGRERVTMEQAPVELLDPQDEIFRSPNPIAPSDFQDWAQERGLYFMSTWDQHYQPLLESHDPGAPPLRGGLLRAQYGKGVYIYTGYSFFRQLPAGVPGAIRLFVNLLAAGHNVR